MPTVQLPPKESNLFKRILVSGRRARAAVGPAGTPARAASGPAPLRPSPIPQDPTPPRLAGPRRARVPTRAAVRAPPPGIAAPFPEASRRPRGHRARARPPGSGPRALGAAVRPRSPPRRPGPPSFLCPRPRGQVFVPCSAFNFLPSAPRSLPKRSHPAARRVSDARRVREGRTGAPGGQASRWGDRACFWCTSPPWEVNT